MKYTFKISISVPDDEFEHSPPTKTDVAKFLHENALYGGGCCFNGDENTPHDWRFVLYRYGIVEIAKTIRITE